MQIETAGEQAEDHWVSLWHLNWEPYRPHGARLRVLRTMPGGEYEFCGEGGRYFILHRDRRGRYEEAGRGLYRQAWKLWLSIGGEP
ncbi:hypothetical protein HTZ77_18550 [Nonomuraea sp. SMC257]|uniref:Uncharacterized protein n=1 Tax=Nonomuraea montanisoli TaxID=2741721 RepID=A0A7Y6I9N7_9ACTN|nr:hypothetical protein [Nonomuraea montanisoli]NUW33415.1 hypothetical protein [Nonomuraea montanisoli]